MATIFVSMSGEGRGHATRMRAIVDELRGAHRVSIYAPGDAYQLLHPAYQGTEVNVQEIPGLRFHYTARHRLDFLRTGGMAARYAVGFRGLRRRLEEEIRRERPDLIIADFEPSLPRAAMACGVPFISLNHQHFLIVNDLGCLPPKLRRHAAYMSLVVRGYYSGQVRTIVSSFYFPPLKPKYRDNVVQVGVILRPSVLRQKVRREGFLVAYLRRFAPANVLAALRQVGMPVVVYGVGKREAEANLTFREISEESFLSDLSGCEALISTAGNQLVGEALYFRKPVLAMPEPGNHEQYINAFFLAHEGTGEWVELEELTAPRLEQFLSRLEEFRERIDPERYNGTPLALRTISEYLSIQSGLSAGNNSPI